MTRALAAIALLVVLAGAGVLWWRWGAQILLANLGGALCA